MPILIHKIIHCSEQTVSPLQIPYVTSAKRWNELKQTRGGALFSSKISNLSPEKQKLPLNSAESTFVACLFSKDPASIIWRLAQNYLVLCGVKNLHTLLSVLVCHTAFHLHFSASSSLLLRRKHPSGLPKHQYFQLISCSFVHNLRAG